MAAGEMVWAARLIEQHFDAVTVCAAKGRPCKGGAALHFEVVRAPAALLVAQASMVWLVAKLGRLKGFSMQPSALPCAAAESRSTPLGR